MYVIELIDQWMYFKLCNDLLWLEFNIDGLLNQDVYMYELNANIKYYQDLS